MPEKTVARMSLSLKQTAIVLAAPAVLAPTIDSVLDFDFLPVLVADYLAIHLAIYGGLQLLLLYLFRVPLGPFSSIAFLMMILGCAFFGLTVNRYAANFWPSLERVQIMALLALGAVSFFIADARLTHNGSLTMRLSVHAAFLLSLLFAVALDFQRLFFLLMIAPVIVLFLIPFGTMGHAARKRAGPLAPGIALGLVLAWSLGVSFPLFAN